MVAVLVASATLAACGGKDEGRPESTRGGATEPLDQCELAGEYELSSLLDFDPIDPTDPEPMRFQNCSLGSSCSLNFNTDIATAAPASDPDTQCPVGAVTESEPPHTAGYIYSSVAGARCGAPEHVGRIFARDLSVCLNPDTGRRGWGGSLSVSFASGSPGIDVSEWDGFAFWIRKAGPSSQVSLIAAVVDGYTNGRSFPHPETGEQIGCDNSGNSIDPVTGNPILDTEKCDGFGVAVSMTDEWSFVPIRFDALRQKGFGLPSPLGHVDTTDVIRLQFLIGAGQWDFEIDELAFFRE